MPGMMMGRLGWGIMIGWAIWCMLLPLVIEILKQSKLGINERSSVYKLNVSNRDNFEKIDRLRKTVNIIVIFKRDQLNFFNDYFSLKESKVFSCVYML